MDAAAAAPSAAAEEGLPPSGIQSRTSVTDIEGALLEFEAAKKAEEERLEAQKAKAERPRLSDRAAAAETTGLLGSGGADDGDPAAAPTEPRLPRLLVRQITGEQTALHLSLDDTIGALKEALRAEWGIEADAQQLLLANYAAGDAGAGGRGLPLAEDETVPLQACGLMDGAELLLTLQDAAQGAARRKLREAARREAAERAEAQRKLHADGPPADLEPVESSQPRKSALCGNTIPLAFVLQVVQVFMIVTLAVDTANPNRCYSSTYKACRCCDHCCDTCSCCDCTCLKFMACFARVEFDSAHEGERCLPSDDCIIMPTGYYFIIIPILLVAMFCDARDSRSLKLLRQVKTDSGVGSHIEHVRNTAPVITWTVRCYSYDSDHERCDSFEATERYQICYWDDISRTPADLTEATITRIKFCKRYAFADEESSRDFETKKRAFKDRHKHRDEKCDLTESFTIEGMQENMLACDNTDAKPWWLAESVFWLSTLLCCGACFRMMFANISYEVPKYEYVKRLYSKRPSPANQGFVICGASPHGV